VNHCEIALVAGISILCTVFIMGTIGTIYANRIGLYDDFALIRKHIEYINAVKNQRLTGLINSKIFSCILLATGQRVYNASDICPVPRILTWHIAVMFLQLHLLPSLPFLLVAIMALATFPRNKEILKRALHRGKTQSVSTLSDAGYVIEYNNRRHWRIPASKGVELQVATGSYSTRVNKWL